MTNTEYHKKYRAKVEKEYPGALTLYALLRRVVNPTEYEKMKENNRKNYPKRKEGINRIKRKMRKEWPAATEYTYQLLLELIDPDRRKSRIKYMKKWHSKNKLKRA